MSYFYKTGIDITNDKQMFNFLKGHTTYYTANSWNDLESIANDVKLYKLELSGDWGTAYDLLANGEYENINWMIQQWCEEHKGYEVYFNGRSGGHLVLTDKDYNGHVLPDLIVESEDYEDYKNCCRANFGSVRINRDALVYYTKLVQDFDKLCDQLRDYCDELSNLKFEVIEMEKSVNDFNIQYENDLEVLEFQELRCDSEGVVDLSEVIMLQSLTEAFLRLAKRDGYKIDWLKENDQTNNKVKLIAA